MKPLLKMKILRRYQAWHLQDDQTGRVTEEVVEDTDAIVSVKETEAQDAEADGPVGSVSGVVVEDPDAIVSFTEKEESLQADDQTDSATEEVVEDTDEIVSYSEEGRGNPSRQTKRWTSQRTLLLALLILKAIPIMQMISRRTSKQMIQLLH